MLVVSCHRQAGKYLKFDYLLEIWAPTDVFSKHPNNRWELIHWTRHFHEESTAIRNIPGEESATIENLL